MSIFSANAFGKIITWWGSNTSSTKSNFSKSSNDEKGLFLWKDL